MPQGDRSERQRDGSGARDRDGQKLPRGLLLLRGLRPEAELEDRGPGLLPTGVAPLLQELQPQAIKDRPLKPLADNPNIP